MGVYTQILSQIYMGRVYERLDLQADVHIIRYEDLLLRCADVLQSSIRHVCGIDIDDSTAEAIAKANSFQSVAKRNPGSGRS